MTIPIYFWFELLALIVCILSFHKLRHSILKWFLPFLFLIVVYEFGTISRWDVFFINKSNHWLANIISTIEILFYSFIFYHVLVSSKFKRAIIAVTIFFIIATILNISFYQGFNRFHTITYRLGSIIIVLWIFLYLKQLMGTAEIVNIAREPLFWISTGLLFFMVGFMLYLTAFDFIAYQTIKKNAALYRVIRYALIIQLYLLFSIAFVWAPKPMK